MSTIVQFPSLGIELPVSRVAFSIGSFDIYWYGIILGLGLALGMVWALKSAREFGVDQDNLIDIILVGTLAGIIGARLYYVIFAAPGEFTSFWQIFDLRRGGVGFYGAVIGGVGSAIFMCRKKKVKLLPVVDIAAVGFLIGQGIGRWGNFFNQEAFGGNTALPWGMTSATVQRYLESNLNSLAEKGIVVDPALPVHPTFLYESLWCALGFILINRYIKRRRFDGEIALMYFAWNGFGRAFIEGLRTDSLYLGSVRISQLLAIVGCAASVMAILAIRAKIKKSPDKGYLMPYGRTDECALELAAIADARAEQKRDGGKGKGSFLDEFKAMFQPTKTAAKPDGGAAESAPESAEAAPGEPITADSAPAEDSAAKPDGGEDAQDAKPEDAEGDNSGKHIYKAKN